MNVEFGGRKPEVPAAVDIPRAPDVPMGGDLPDGGGPDLTRLGAGERETEQRDVTAPIHRRHRVGARESKPTPESAAESAAAASPAEQTEIINAGSDIANTTGTTSEPTRNVDGARVAEPPEPARESSEKPWDMPPPGKEAVTETVPDTTPPDTPQTPPPPASPWDTPPRTASPEPIPAEPSPEPVTAEPPEVPGPAEAVEPVQPTEPTGAPEPAFEEHVPPAETAETGVDSDAVADAEAVDTNEKPSPTEVAGELATGEAVEVSTEVTEPTDETVDTTDKTGGATIGQETQTEIPAGDGASGGPDVSAPTEPGESPEPEPAAADTRAEIGAEAAEAAEPTLADGGTTENSDPVPAETSSESTAPSHVPTPDPESSANTPPAQPATPLHAPTRPSTTNDSLRVPQPQTFRQRLLEVTRDVVIGAPGALVDSLLPHVNRVKKVEGGEAGFMKHQVTVKFLGRTRTYTVRAPRFAAGIVARAKALLDF